MGFSKKNKVIIAIILVFALVFIAIFVQKNISKPKEPSIVINSMQIPVSNLSTEVNNILRDKKITNKEFSPIQIGDYFDYKNDWFTMYITLTDEDPNSGQYIMLYVFKIIDSKAKVVTVKQDNEWLTEESLPKDIPRDVLVNLVRP